MWVEPKKLKPIPHLQLVIKPQRKPPRKSQRQPTMINTVGVRIRKRYWLLVNRPQVVMLEAGLWEWNSKTNVLNVVKKEHCSGIFSMLETKLETGEESD